MDVLRKAVFTLVVLCYPGLCIRGQEATRGDRGASWDVYADTWVGTDALGRTLPGLDVCGAPRPDKIVALFYWTWHIPGNNADRGPFDNTDITARALVEDAPAEWPSIRANHFWGEPELGYYLSTDPFVLRRHASMLADAGVDVIVFDTTNPPWTWKEAYMALGREFTAMRRAGNRTPDIAFMCPFGDPTVVVERVVEEMYEPGLFRDLWFIWDKRPLILANPRYFREQASIRDFFTFRRPIPGYWTRPRGPGEWPWLQVFPQHAFPDADGNTEVVAVGVAQNAIPGAYGPAPMSHRVGAMGRSWHDGARDPDADATDYGLNFQEQWDRAAALDPRVVFVTGWNEWTAIRLPTFGPYNEREHPYYRRGLFIDQYNREYSRDCEPMAGGHTDSYYYQLMANIRRFKGVRTRPRPSGPAHVRIDGRFDEWREIMPEFRDTIGDTMHRSHPGYGGHIYTNNTGRNDIVRCKAAYDDAQVSFHVGTREDISAAEGHNWMLLFIDVDQDSASGWEGYDLVVNETRDVQGRASVRRAFRRRNWEHAGWAELAVHGKELELALPGALFPHRVDGMPAFDFHWADNIQRLAIEEFGVNGDSAPNRRCRYRFGADLDVARADLLGYFPDELPDADDDSGVPDELYDLHACDWIWHPAVPDAREAAPLGQVHFRRNLIVPGADKTTVFIVVAADNQAAITVDGEVVGAASGWTPPTGFPLTLSAGEHALDVLVSNVGDEPNPAGLAALVAVRRTDNTLRMLARTGDGDWQAKAAEDDAWQPAKRLIAVGEAPWGVLR